MKWKVDDLPPHLQGAAQAQINGQAPKAAPPARPGPVGACPKKAAAPAPKAASPRHAAPKTPVRGIKQGDEIGSDGTVLYGSAGKHKGRARSQHIPGRMNGTESKYADRLNERIVAGEVVWWKFESVKFRLGPACYYTPDFLISLSDGTLEIHEVKGFMEEDARVKLSVMKEMYPFKIWLIRLNKNAWDMKPA